MRDQFPKMLAVAKREYLEGIRSPWFILATLFGPVVFVVMFLVPLLVASSNTTTDDFTTALYNVRVIDATTTGLGERVAQILGGGKYANQPMPLVRVVPTTDLDKTEALSIEETKNDQASGYLVIDSQTVATGAVRYVGRGANSALDTLQIKNAIREGLIGYRLEQRGMTPGEIDSLTVISPELIAVPFREGHTQNPLDNTKASLAFFLTMLLYTSIVLYGQTMLSSVVEEKSTRVAEIVISSIRPSALLSGKIFGISALGLTQQLFWILGALVLSMIGKHFIPTQADPALALASSIPFTTIAAYLAFFIFGFLLFGSLYAAAGSTVSSDSDARQAGQPIVLLLVVSILCLTPIVSAPTSTFAQVLTLIPITSPILMPLRMAVTEVPRWEIIASFGILIVTCILTIRLAARIYRVGLLMYGKRPSFNELRRWLKHR